MYITNLITNKTFSRPISISNHSKYICDSRIHVQINTLQVYILITLTHQHIFFLQTGHRQSYRSEKTVWEDSSGSVWCQACNPWQMSSAKSKQLDLSGIYQPQIIIRNYSVVSFSLRKYHGGGKDSFGKDMSYMYAKVPRKYNNTKHIMYRSKINSPLILPQTELLIT